MNQCEVSMVEKEKEMSFLKCNLQELKERLNGKEEEINLLRMKNIETEEEIHLVKERNQELKNHFEREIETLTYENQLLQTNTNSFENQLVNLKKLYIKGLSQVTLINNHVDDVNNNLANDVMLSKPPLTINDEIKTLKEDIIVANNEIRATMGNKDKSRNKNANEINKLSAQITTSGEGEAIQHNFNSGSEVMDLMTSWQKDVDKAIKNIEYHVGNIENIMFSNSSNSLKEIILKWKLQNFQHHFDIGKDVYSPIFFTQLNGYCFKLCIGWNGKEKENMGMFLYFCRGSNYEKDLEVFNMQYSLEMINNNGFKLSHQITIADIEANRVNHFVLQPGENESKLGYGIPKFLRRSELKTFIVNDMLSIQCRLTPLRKITK